MIYADAPNSHILPMTFETQLAREHINNPNINNNNINTNNIPLLRDKFIILNSCSKTWGATGWRVGWCISPETITPKIRAVHDQMVLQSPTPLQYGAEGFLQMPDEYFFRELPVAYQERRDFLIPELEKIGFEFLSGPPMATYYAFCTYGKIEKLKKYSGKPMECCKYLIEEIGVAAVI